LRSLLFIVVQLRRTLLLHHSYTMLPMYKQFTVEKEGLLNFCSLFRNITLGALFQI